MYSLSVHLNYTVKYHEKLAILKCREKTSTVAGRSHRCSADTNQAILYYGPIFMLKTREIKMNAAPQEGGTLITISVS